MHLLHCSLCFYSSSSSSFLPLLLSFLPLLFSFLPKLLPSLFFFSCFPLPPFPSSPHFVFLLCPFLLPSPAFPLFWSSSIYFHLTFLSFFLFLLLQLSHLLLFFFFPFILSFSFVPIFFPLFFSPYHTPFFFLRELLVLNAF